MMTSSYGEGATFATNAGANNENLTYDKNGNILTLARYLKGTGQIDNLTYTYKNGNASNMLDRVDDAVSGTNGFSELVKQANEYGYDGNGNLIKDDNKGYNSILYNYLNLPKQVGTTSTYISYVYDAAGTKLAKVGTGGAYTYYAGSFVYSGSSLNYIINREGMYLPGGNYQYYLKDHLGNTRLVVNTSGTGGTVVQQTDFYPFGMDITVYNGGLDNKYRYNGKEFQDDMINGKSLQWYDYGARFYDPQIGRWHTVDPLAEKYRRWSPYNYCVNNPLKLTDPDGRGPELALYFVPGVGEALLAATVIVAVSYVVYKASEATYNAVKDAKAGYKEQQKREGASQRETSKIQQKHDESVEKSVGKPTPDGDNTPKGGGSTIAKVVAGTGLASEFVRACNETTGGNNQNNNSGNASNNQSAGNTETTISQGNTKNENTVGTGTNSTFTVPTYTMPVDNTRVNSPIIPLRIDEKN